MVLKHFFGGGFGVFKTFDFISKGFSRFFKCFYFTFIAGRYFIFFIFQRSQFFIQAGKLIGSFLHLSKRGIGFSGRRLSKFGSYYAITHFNSCALIHDRGLRHFSQYCFYRCARYAVRPLVDSYKILFVDFTLSQVNKNEPLVTANIENRAFFS